MWFLKRIREWCRARRNTEVVAVAADAAAVRLLRRGGFAGLSFFWSDVREVETFKLDLGTTDLIVLAFYLPDGTVVEVHEDLNGFAQLREQMNHAFVGLQKDWYEHVMLPAFATNRRVIFERGARLTPLESDRSE